MGSRRARSIGRVFTLHWESPATSFGNRWFSPVRFNVGKAIPGIGVPRRNTVVVVVVTPAPSTTAGNLSTASTSGGKQWNPMPAACLHSAEPTGPSPHFALEVVYRLDVEGTRSQSLPFGAERGFSRSLSHVQALPPLRGRSLPCSATIEAGCRSAGQIVKPCRAAAAQPCLHTRGCRMVWEFTHK